MSQDQQHIYAAQPSMKHILLVDDCMELYLFRHSTWEQRYSCDYLTEDEWNVKRITRVPHGVFSIIFATVALMLYIPCMMILRRQQFMQNTCYKIMFYLGIVDIVSQLLDGFLNGYLLIVGAVFCNYPHFIYLSGTFVFAIWCVQCGLCSLLALNRFIDTCIGKDVTETLFEGYRTHIWCMACFSYGTVMVFVSPSLIFTSTGGSWFYDPYIGYDNVTQVDRSWYFNKMMGINNIGIVFVLVFLYTGMLIKIMIQSRRGGVTFQKAIFCQAAFICLLNAVPALIYLYMQFCSAPEWLIAVGHFAWQGSNGGPAFIYIFFNKTIQRNVLAMVGMKRGSSTAVSTLKPSGAGGSRFSQATISAHHSHSKY